MEGAAQKSMATSAITSPLLLMAMVVVNQGRGRWGGQSTISTQQVIWAENLYLCHRDCGNYNSCEINFTVGIISIVSLPSWNLVRISELIHTVIRAKGVIFLLPYPYSGFPFAFSFCLIEGKRIRGQQRIRWLDSITNSMDVNLSKLWEIVKNRGAWRAIIDGVTKGRTWLSNWTTRISCLI